MKRFLAAIAVAAALPALAQAPKSGVQGGAVVASEPGKAAAVAAVEVVATVVAIEKATRTVTIRGPEGKAVDIVAGDEVKNFDQIRAVTRSLAPARSSRCGPGPGSRRVVVPGRRGFCGAAHPVPYEVVLDHC